RSAWAFPPRPRSASIAKKSGSGSARSGSRVPPSVRGDRPWGPWFGTGWPHESDRVAPGPVPPSLRSRSGSGSPSWRRPTDGPDPLRARISDAGGMGAARGDLDRLAPEPRRLAGQVRADLLGLHRDRPPLEPG